MTDHLSDERGDRLPSHGPLTERDLPDEPQWREVRNQDLRADPGQWLRWDDAVSAVRSGRSVSACAEYARHLGAKHPIVQYLRAHDNTAEGDVKAQLEYLRGELRAEQISWGDLADLQGLAKHIDRDDVELLEAAGVPEFPDGDMVCKHCGESIAWSDSIGRWLAAQARGLDLCTAGDGNGEHRPVVTEVTSEVYEEFALFTCTEEDRWLIGGRDTVDNPDDESIVTCRHCGARASECDGTVRLNRAYRSVNH